jgi:hypothetical protein
MPINRSTVLLFAGGIFVGAGGMALVSKIALGVIIWDATLPSLGDWLQAVAGIIGVALTVRATLWLEERSRKNERKEKRRLLNEALLLLQRTAILIQQPFDAGASLEDRRHLTAVHYELLRNGRESLAYARQDFRAQIFNVWMSLTVVDEHLTTHLPVLTREEAIVRGQHVTELVLAISREKIEHFAEVIQQPVTAAIEALRNDAI